jgi:hypothetical protein
MILEFVIPVMDLINPSMAYDRNRWREFSVFNKNGEVEVTDAMMGIFLESENHTLLWDIEGGQKTPRSVKLRSHHQYISNCNGFLMKDAVSTEYHQQRGKLITMFLLENIAKPFTCWSVCF